MHNCLELKCIETWGVNHCDGCLQFSPDIPCECCLWKEVERLRGIEALALARQKVEQKMDKDFVWRGRYETEWVSVNEKLEAALAFNIEKRVGEIK